MQNQHNAEQSLPETVFSTMQNDIGLPHPHTKNFMQPNQDCRNENCKPDTANTKHRVSHINGCDLQIK